MTCYCYLITQLGILSGPGVLFFFTLCRILLDMLCLLAHYGASSIIFKTFLKMWTMLGSLSTSCKDRPASIQLLSTNCFWMYRCWHVLTHINTCILHHSSLLQHGKLSPWALQGVPPNLIVAFPYRTRWHLVDFLSSIILSGKWLFPTSCVMVYRENEGLWWGQGLGNRIKHQWSNAGICRPDLFSFASLCLILFQMYFWMTYSNLSCVTSRDGSA